MASKGGRPVDPIWQVYVRVSTDGKVPKAKCTESECETMVSAKVERLRAHRQKCKVVSKECNSPRKRPVADTEIDPDFPATSSNSDTDPPPAKRPRSSLSQPHISTFAVKTDNKAKCSLDQQVTRFFYACNIPFNVAEHPEFKILIETLRPGYTPPKGVVWKQLSGPLLDTVFDDITQFVAKEVKGKNVPLVQDGWSDIHNQGRIQDLWKGGGAAATLFEDPLWNFKRGGGVQGARALFGPP